MWRGKERVHAANVHNVWISQRARACFQALAVTEQTAIEAVVGEGMCTMLLRLPVVHPLRRVHNRLVIA